MHRLRTDLLNRQVAVLVVGAGGTGSAFAAGLPWLHQSLLAFGHPRGLRVTLMDGDVVSPANCVRQAFTSAEVGLNKATVIVSRINLFFGYDWEALPARLGRNGDRPGHYDIVVGCVDTRAARNEIHRHCITTGATYWLDVGNNDGDGQFILGEPHASRDPYGRPREANPRRLPTVAEIFPELVDPSLDNDALPSCSALEALTRQAPFINQVLANHALFMLAELFRFGRLNHHGAFVNPRTGRANPIPVPAPSLSRTDWKLLNNLRRNEWPREMAEYALELDARELDALIGDRWCN